MKKETVMCTCVECTEIRNQERHRAEDNEKRLKKGIVEAKIATDRQKLKEHGIVYQD